MPGDFPARWRRLWLLVGFCIVVRAETNRRILDGLITGLLKMPDGSVVPMFPRHLPPPEGVDVAREVAVDCWRRLAEIGGATR